MVDECALDSDTLEPTKRRTLPFGAPRGNQPTAWTGEKGFVGGTNDTATGLTHIGAREYNPDTGRFITVDPILDATDPVQMNGYAYANHSPITHSDPTGLKVLAGFTDNNKPVTVNPSTGNFNTNKGHNLTPTGKPTIGSYWGGSGDTSSPGHGTTPPTENAGGRGGRQSDSTDSGYDPTKTRACLEVGRCGHAPPPGRSALPFVDSLAAFIGIKQCTYGYDGSQCALEAGMLILGGPIKYLGKGGMWLWKAIRKSDEAGRTVNELPTVHWGQQGKHIPGHPNYIPGRSTLTANPDDLIQRAGTGAPVGRTPRGQPGFKERIDFDDEIGTWVSSDGTISSPTSSGILHYRADGSVHIIPARPQ